jgi:hypothetical protein
MPGVFDMHEIDTKIKLLDEISTTPTPSMAILWKTRPQRQRHTPRSWVIRRSLGLNGNLYRLHGKCYNLLDHDGELVFTFRRISLNTDEFG